MTGEVKCWHRGFPYACKEAGVAYTCDSCDGSWVSVPWSDDYAQEDILAFVEWLGTDYRPPIRWVAAS